MTAAVNTAPTLVHALQLRAEQEPDRVAFRFVGERITRQEAITYAELDRRARIVAGELTSLGAAGGRALLLHPPGLDYIVALLGCFYAGVTAVPAYPPGAGRPISRLAAIVQDANARWALTTERALEHVKPLFQTETRLEELVWIASDRLTDEPRNGAPRSPALDSLALLQYTSGSTSAPKGVMVSHGNFVHNIVSLSERAAMNVEDRVVAWLPPYHDMGLVGAILLPLYIGVESILLAPSTFLKRPGLWLEAIAQLGGTVSGGPNFGYELCVRRLSPEQRASYDLRAWRLAFSGAERVSPETLERFTEAFRDAGFDPTAFAPCYGLAESTLGVSFCLTTIPAPVQTFETSGFASGQARPIDSNETGTTLVGCGPALEGVEVAIVDPETRLRRGENEIGEIWVRSPSVAAGYWNQPELTEHTFAAGLASEPASDQNRYLRTGDLGFLSDGNLFVTGRIKDLIILGGVNFYPEDVETTVTHCHPELHGAVAAFSVDHGNEERLVVVCEVNARREAADEDIVKAVRKAVADRLELSVQEVLLVRAGALPRTSSGKLQRGLCRKQYVEKQL